jgi:serine/threonine-protein kinase
VPDVTGKALNDAIATLQNRGFKTNTQQQDSSDVKPGFVVSTQPGANSSVSAGDDITINVSGGPKQQLVPDVTNLNPTDATDKLKAAGFDNVKQALSASAPEQRCRVTGTVPAANSTSAITNVITIVVGSGPDSRLVPDCTNLSATDCDQIVKQSGFPNTAIVEVDGIKPAGSVLGTNPPAGQTVSVDTVIQILVSKGNQFTMPSLRGQFWDEAAPYLASLGWTGNLNKLPNAQNSGIPSNGIVTQDPAAGAPIKFGDPITLSFAN